MEYYVQSRLAAPLFFISDHVIFVIHFSLYHVLKGQKIFRCIYLCNVSLLRFDYVGKFWKEKGNHKVINYHDYMSGGIQSNPNDLLAVSNQSEIEDNGEINCTHTEWLRG
ncbi:unnamed protein product [Cylicocyclus nassatus]|uniref:Ig-like domain-containing protein n=1 Tax=Cylicocyclus nassatus TaxID=53992 RepID=A0AA36HGR3_CYLNA|nr:unnamed protein product [Cylicocyclus nassatus]